MVKHIDEIRTVSTHTVAQLLAPLFLVALLAVSTVAMLVYLPLMVLPAPRRAFVRFVLAVFDVDGFVPGRSSADRPLVLATAGA